MTHSVTLCRDQAAWGGPFLQGRMAATLNSSPGLWKKAQHSWTTLTPGTSGLFCSQMGVATHSPLCPGDWSAHHAKPGQGGAGIGAERRQGWPRQQLGVASAARDHSEQRGTARLLLTTHSWGQAPASTALKAPSTGEMEAPNSCWLPGQKPRPPRHQSAPRAPRLTQALVLP